METTKLRVNIRGTFPSQDPYKPASFGLRDYYSAQIAGRSEGDAALNSGEAYPATPLASTPPASPTRARRFSQSRPPPVLRGLQAVASADGGVAAAASGPPSPRSRRFSSGADVPAMPSSRRSIGGHEDVAPPPSLPPSLIAGYSPRGPPRSRPQSLHPRRAGSGTEGDDAAQLLPVDAPVGAEARVLGGEDRERQGRRDRFEGNHDPLHGPEGQPPPEHERRDRGHRPIREPKDQNGSDRDHAEGERETDPSPQPASRLPAACHLPPVLRPTRPQP